MKSRYVLKQLSVLNHYNDPSYEYFCWPGGDSSGSFDWSAPVTRAEESLSLNWDDDEGAESDDSQKPIQMKVNQVNSVDPATEGNVIVIML